MYRERIEFSVLGGDGGIDGVEWTKAVEKEDNDQMVWTGLNYLAVHCESQ